MEEWFDRWKKQALMVYQMQLREGVLVYLHIRNKKNIISASKNAIQSLRDFTKSEMAKIGKSASLKTIKKILKKAGFIWNRLRKSLKEKRDKTLFFVSRRVNHFSTAS